MKQTLLATLLLVLLMAGCVSKGLCMSNNEQIIKDVTTLTEQFESRPEAELLRQAYQKLEGIRFHTETRPEVRLKLRAATSGLWIRLLNLVDLHLPADFDPEQTVQVKPPQFKGRDGELYPPGVDPQTIRDPQERSAYIKTLTEHRRAQEAYRLRMHLYRLNDQLSESARNYFILAYLGTKPEQEEFRATIAAGIRRADRKAEFLRYVRL